MIKKEKVGHLKKEKVGHLKKERKKGFGNLCVGRNQKLRHSGILCVENVKI